MLDTLTPAAFAHDAKHFTPPSTFLESKQVESFQQCIPRAKINAATQLFVLFSAGVIISRFNGLWKTETRLPKLIIYMSCSADSRNVPPVSSKYSFSSCSSRPTFGIVVIFINVRVALIRLKADCPVLFSRPIKDTLKWSLQTHTLRPACLCPQLTEWFNIALFLL